MKRHGLCLLAAILMIMLYAVPAFADEEAAPTVTNTETEAAAKVKEGWEGSNYYVNGEMLKDTVKKINGAYYCFDKNGKMVKNSFVKTGGKYYLLQKNGKAFTGGLKKVKDSWYFFGKNGAAVTNKFKKVTSGKKKYTYYFGKDGAAYAAEEDMFTYTFQPYKIGKKTYGFDEKAHMVTGIWMFGTETKDVIYCFGKNGVCDAAKSKKLTKLIRYKKSKTIYKDVVKAFGKPKKIRKSDACNAFNGGDEKYYKDYNLCYDHIEIAIGKDTRSGVFCMYGATLISR